MNIEKFDPTAAELTKIADEAKSIVIKDYNDKEGIALADEMRKKLKTARVQIQKTGKEMREEAVNFQRAVIAKEKELVAIIEPVEQEIKQKLDEIEKQKEIEQRKLVLPDRRSQVEQLGFEPDDEQLLQMDSEQFADFIRGKKEERLELDRKAFEEERIKKAQEEAERKAAEEAKLAEERRKIEEEKALIAEEQRKIDEAKRINEARKEAEERARKEAEARAQEEKERAEREKKEAEERARQEERDRIAAEQAEVERKRKEAEEKKAAEEAEKARQEALRPDKDKMLAFAKTLSDIEVPQCATEKGQAFARMIKEELNEIANKINNNIENL